MQLFDYQIDQRILACAAEAEKSIEPALAKLTEVSEYNHAKVLSAFQAERVNDYHFNGTNGYGLGDEGRDNLERVVARIFMAEKALVRSQIVSGTHAIALCLYGVLRPGDEMLSVTGTPYDTLEELIGIRGDAGGSLKDLGVSYRQVDLDSEGKPQLEKIAAAITPMTRLVAIQRSRGYAWRRSIDINGIKGIIDVVKAVNPNIVVFVDNCYGELVEKQEPTEVGADLVAGSLIKNLGGGIAPIGGYVAGKSAYVDLAANRLTAPGIGSAVGATLGINRLLYQGLYLSPVVVREAVSGAIFAASLFAGLGFEVSPNFTEERTDLIQAIKLGTPEGMIAFCQGLQKGSPIDAYVVPEPSGMPGYGDQVIMAGGTFVQGATSELSADGPLREPYAVYLQGGLSYNYVKLGVLLAAQSLLDKGILKL
ncbi:MAG TPA: methionine gamma-lyase family protein [Candidatus Deferrimicrobium sp.]|nr:methionine gamma-lyase family protein [Candidatus Deferrimicrobium sp.]